MPTIEVLTGPGLTFKGNKLTTDWGTESDSTIVPTINEEGIKVPDLIGKDDKNKDILDEDTRVDNATIISTLDRRLRINREVVQFIHSMCAFKVINRETIKGYEVDVNTPKTIIDIMEEMNIMMRTDEYLDINKYSLVPNNFFQLIYNSHPVKEPGWPIALDGNTRMFGDSTLALFVIEECEYDSGRADYITTLAIRCLWSKIASFSKGTKYKATSANSNEPITEIISTN